MRMRPFVENDIKRIVDLWIEVSNQAHDFIPFPYWLENRTKMEETYLPSSITYVLEEDSRIVGFVSMMDHYLAALFVANEEQGKGYGTKLLEYVKSLYPVIELKVFQKNKSAVLFYKRSGFTIKEESFDKETSEKEYLMVWSSSKKEASLD